MCTEKSEIFLSELEDFMRNVKKLSNSSVKIYLKRIRNLLETQYSVNDLCGIADRLWTDYGPRGQLYDPADHGNTRAAIRHVDDLCRTQLLKKAGNLYVSYEMDYASFKKKGRYESGYTIQDGTITFSYNNGFSKGKDVVKKISSTNLRTLIRLFEQAYESGCLAASDTYIRTEHGSLCKYSYSFADVAGNNCGSLLNGSSSYVKQLSKEYDDLIEKLRS